MDGILDGYIGQIIGIVAIYFVARAALGIVLEAFREARRQRDHYYLMPFMDREAMVKAIFYTLECGGEMSPYEVAAALDLSHYCTDEAIICLTRNGYLDSDAESLFSSTLTRPTRLTAKGRAYYEDYLQTSGDTINVGPWGTVITRTTMTGSMISQENSVAAVGVGIPVPSPGRQMTFPQPDVTIPEAGPPSPKRVVAKDDPGWSGLFLARSPARRLLLMGEAVLIAALLLMLLTALQHGTVRNLLALSPDLLFMVLAVVGVHHRGRRRRVWLFVLLGASAWPVLMPVLLIDSLQLWGLILGSSGMVLQGQNTLIVSAVIFAVGAVLLSTGVVWEARLRPAISWPAIAAWAVAVLHGILLQRLIIGDFDDFTSLHVWPTLLVGFVLTSLVFLIGSSRQSSLPWALAGWSVIAFAAILVQTHSILYRGFFWIGGPVVVDFKVSQFVAPTLMLFLALALRKRPFAYLPVEVDLRDTQTRVK